MADINQLLAGFGLTEKEVKVYLALLQLGTTGVGQIARKAMIKRPTAYLILEELRQKGLLLKLPQAKKTHYQARSADELYEQLHGKLTELGRALPQLRSLEAGRKEFKTLYYEGATEIEEALRYKLKELRGTELIGFFAKGEGVAEKFAKISQKWDAEMAHLGVTIRGLTPDHETTRYFKEKFPERYSNLRLITKEQYGADVSIEITNLYVRIIDLHQEQAVIIENARLVRAMKDIFRLAEKGA